METLTHEGIIRVKFPVEEGGEPEQALEAIAANIALGIGYGLAEEAQVVREAVMIVTDEDREAFEDAAKALELGRSDAALAARFRGFAMHETLDVQPITTYDHRAAMREGLGGL